jgi:hypothetical protein
MEPMARFWKDYTKYVPDFWLKGWHFAVCNELDSEQEKGEAHPGLSPNFCPTTENIFKKIWV